MQEHVGGGNDGDNEGQMMPHVGGDDGGANGNQGQQQQGLHVPQEPHQQQQGVGVEFNELLIGGHFAGGAGGGAGVNDPAPWVQGGEQDPGVATPSRPRSPQVVACYEGKGRVAHEGFQDPEWVEGRLWVYDDGTIGFLWLGQFGFLIDYWRLDADL